MWGSTFSSYPANSNGPAVFHGKDQKSVPSPNVSLDHLAYYEREPPCPSCPLGCCHGQEDRRADDSIPLFGSLPYTHWIRLGNDTVSVVLADGSVSGWPNPCVVSHR